MRNTPYMQCRIWYLGKTAEKRVEKIGGGDRLLDSWISDETHCRVFEIASQISDNFWRRQVRKFCYSKFPISNLLHVSDFVTLVYNRFPVKRRVELSSYPIRNLTEKKSTINPVVFCVKCNVTWIWLWRGKFLKPWHSEKKVSKLPLWESTTWPSIRLPYTIVKFPPKREILLLIAMPSAKYSTPYN